MTATGAPPDVPAAIARMLVQTFDLSAEQVTPEARLREDLDMDSLDGVDLIVQIEKVFQVRVDDEVVKQIRTVGEIHTYVAELIASSAR